MPFPYGPSSIFSSVVGTLVVPPCSPRRSLPLDLAVMLPKGTELTDITHFFVDCL